MPNAPKDEGFLDRWSRMKTEGEPADSEEKPETKSALPEEVLTDAELLEKLGLPDPETLKPGDDFRGFMSSQVPDHLRKIALRILWRSNPLLANVDGLVEYGEDFTDSATVVENLQTIYQVGKGSAWKFQEEQEALRAAELETEADANTNSDMLHRTIEEADPSQNQKEHEAVLLPDTENTLIQSVARNNDDETELVADATPRPRPMQFDFD